MTDLEKYWPTAIVVTIFVFVIGTLYDSHIKDEARKCDHAVQVIVDYATCEAMEDCVIQLKDVQEYSAQIKVNKKCEVKNDND